MKTIDKVGGIILCDKKILVVQKKCSTDKNEYILPGGKRQCGENDYQTLARELKEETSIDIKSLEYFGEFEDIALYENVPIIIKSYLVYTDSEIVVQNEISCYKWIDRNYEHQGIHLGSVLSKYIIPRLIELDLM